MSSVAAPFGLRPLYHLSGELRTSAYRGALVISAAQTLYEGTPIVYTPSTKTFAQADANAGSSSAGSVVLGAFMGIEYDDVNKKRTFSNFIAGSTTISTTSNIVVYVADDPNIVFAVQSSGTLAETSRGLQFNLTNLTAGSSVTGLSGATIGTSAITTASYGHFLVTELFKDVGNEWGDTYTTVQGLLVSPQNGASRRAAL